MRITCDRSLLRQVLSALLLFSAATLLLNYTLSFEEAEEEASALATAQTHRSALNIRVRKQHDNAIVDEGAEPSDEASVPCASGARELAERAPLRQNKLAFFVTIADVEPKAIRNVEYAACLGRLFALQVPVYAVISECKYII